MYSVSQAQMPKAPGLPDCVETAVSSRIVAMNITGYPGGEENSTSK